MEDSAFLDDLVKNTISIIDFEETAASNNAIKDYNDALRILLLGSW